MNYRVVCALFVAGLLAPWASAQVPAGGEFQVNTYTYNGQRYPGVALSDGGFVVAWSAYSQGSNYYGIDARRFDSAGAPRGAEFHVGSHTAGSQYTPILASNAAGNFLVVWAGAGLDGSGAGVFGQRYDASGAPRGAQFQANQFTLGDQRAPKVAVDAAGGFIVAWESADQDGDGLGVFARRYDASGAPRGAEFKVNSYTTGNQGSPAVAAGGSGSFVIAWEGYFQDGSSSGVSARRYDASGAPLGGEFQVNTYTTGPQFHAAVASASDGRFVVAWNGYPPLRAFAQLYDASGARVGGEFSVGSSTGSMQGEPAVASDAAGGFVVTWRGYDAAATGIFAHRFDAAGAPRGAEFQVNTYTTSRQEVQAVASDSAGNAVVVWQSIDQDGSGLGVFAQRYGGIVPAALSVDASASSGSDGNGVLEPGETSVAVAPSWRNVNGAAQTFDGAGLSFSGPPAAGVSYSLLDTAGVYGTVANGATAACSDCYQVGVGFSGTRPATHWDATFSERLTPDALGQTKLWSLHVGGSFTDVPKASGYYRFVETLLHRGVTGGCSATSYCPANAVTREQLSVFALVGKEGAGYLPAACSTPVFGDVPASSPFCRYIEDLARRGVVSGCGGGNYCPASPVTREQMPVFMVRVLDPALSPPACGTPVFADVPASSPYCKWIEELARRGVVSGCGGGNYCPSDPVTREQMAVFISVTFGLSLYGP